MLRCSTSRLWAKFDRGPFSHTEHADRPLIGPIAESQRGGGTSEIAQTQPKLREATSVFATYDPIVPQVTSGLGSRASGFEAFEILARQT